LLLAVHKYYFNFDWFHGIIGDIHHRELFIGTVVRAIVIVAATAAAVATAAAIRVIVNNNHNSYV
jgi:hypothetical protein